MDISNKLHLSDIAISQIQQFIDDGERHFEDYNGFTNILNAVLESDEFYSVIKLIAFECLEFDVKCNDSEYAAFVSAKKMCELIKRIQESSCYNFDSYVSFRDDKVMQKDYHEYLFEKIASSREETAEKLKALKKHDTELADKMISEYKSSTRYKALINLYGKGTIDKEASENGKHIKP